MNAQRPVEGGNGQFLTSIFCLFYKRILHKWIESDEINIGPNPTLANFFVFGILALRVSFNKIGGAKSMQSRFFSGRFVVFDFLADYQHTMECQTIVPAPSVYTLSNTDQCHAKTIVRVQQYNVVRARQRAWVPAIRYAVGCMGKKILFSVCVFANVSIHVQIKHIITDNKLFKFEKRKATWRRACIYARECTNSLCSVNFTKIRIYACILVCIWFQHTYNGHATKRTKTKWHEYNELMMSVFVCEWSEKPTKQMFSYIGIYEIVL